jgi:hypothetical protein
MGSMRGKGGEGDRPLPLKLCPTMTTHGSSQWKGGPPPKDEEEDGMKAADRSQVDVR